MARKQTKIQTEKQPGAVIYCRCSTDEQATSGLGLEAQERRCRAWAEANGLDVLAIFIDAGASAKTLRRPELEKAITGLKPGNILVSYKIDRLTRSLKDFPELNERVQGAGAELATVEEKFDTSTAMGRAMLNIILTFSQLEREQTGERTKAALAEKKARGERLGTTPLGFLMVDGGLVEDPEGQATVSRARELKDGGKSLREVAATLTAEGRRTKRGGAWQAETVRKLIAPRYIEGLAAAA